MILATTPLLPCRPAILSPTDNLRFEAINTRTDLITPESISSPAATRFACSLCLDLRSSNRLVKPLMISKILFLIGEGSIEILSYTCESFRSNVFVILRFAGIITSSVLELVTSKGIFSPSNMLLKFSVNCS